MDRGECMLFARSSNVPEENTGAIQELIQEIIQELIQGLDEISAGRARALGRVWRQLSPEFPSERIGS